MLRFRPSSATSPISGIPHYTSSRGFPRVATESNARENPSPTLRLLILAGALIMGTQRGSPFWGLGSLLELTGRFTPGPPTCVCRCVRPPRWVWSAWTPRSRGVSLQTHSIVSSYSLIVIKVPYRNWNRPAPRGEAIPRGNPHNHQRNLRLCIHTPADTCLLIIQRSIISHLCRVATMSSYREVEGGKISSLHHHTGMNTQIANDQSFIFSQLGRGR